MSRADDWAAHRFAAPALLVALAIPLILMGLGRYGLVNGDEEVYHVVARHMVESGNWLHLDFYGAHRVYDTFMNAPLQYWARAITISIFGDSLFSMRILSALCAVASVLLTYRFVREIATPRAALLAGLAQLTTLQFVYLHSARTGELEPALTLGFTGALMLFVRNVRRGESWLPHHLLLVVLLNLKAPFVLVPLLAEAVCFAVVPATRARLREWLMASLWILPLGAVWHWAHLIHLWTPFVDVISKMGDQASGEHAQKWVIGPGSEIDFAPLRNLVFYASTLAFGAFPYSLIYPLAIVGVLRGRDAAERLPWTLTAVFIGVLLLFYILIEKHHNWYVVPIYPLLCAFVGGWLDDLRRRPLGVAATSLIAFVVAALIWSKPDFAAFNPFAARAYLLPLELRLADHFGLPGWLGLALATAAIAGLMLGVRDRAGARFAPGLSVVLAVGLIATAGVRVSWPLAKLDTLSPTAEFRQQLDELARSAAPIGYPVDAPVEYAWDTRFYFDHDYEIVRLDTARYRLYPKGDERAGGDRAE